MSWWPNHDIRVCYGEWDNSTAAGQGRRLTIEWIADLWQSARPPHCHEADGKQPQQSARAERTAQALPGTARPRGSTPQPRRPCYPPLPVRSRSL
jgi:hypothetical protein